MKFTIKQQHLIRLALFVVAVAITVYALPRAGEHRYHYQENRPWSYQLLTAPFDIPIYLDSVSASAVRDSIDRTFEPVYNRDNVVENDVVQQFAERLNHTPTPVSHAKRNALIQELRKVYSSGVVDQRTYSEIVQGRLPAVKFVHDNVAISMPASAFRTGRAAYAHLDSVFADTVARRAIAETGLAELLVPNIVYDTVETDRMRTELYRKAMAPRGVIQQGERIIDEGDVVTSQLYTVLQTYEQLQREKQGGTSDSSLYLLGGQALYMMLLFGLMYGFLYMFRPEYYRDMRKLAFIVTVVTAFAVFGFIMDATFTRGLYLTPLVIVPILLIIFLDSRVALYSHIVTVMILALVAVNPLEFIFLQVVGGTVAIQSIKDLTKRSQLISSAFFIFLSYCFAFLAMRLAQMGAVSKIPLDMFGSLAINGILVSFAYVMIFFVEKIFGFTSKVTLVELSDINNKVLRALSEECPGTFQHSMAVSNLASAAASRIGANVQLVRTGALYHDIGKIDNPAFFTENQHGVNPHDALDPIQSARIVTNHVTDGLRRADKAKLPQVIRDFITEHHGRGTARYFYTTYCNQHPDEEVDIRQFQYPGPNPRSRETSILMMADAIEASSRSLKDHTPEAISALVNRIIDTQIAEGLHNDSPLSFRDIRDIKDVFISRLRTMYHSRISYPDAKKPSHPVAAVPDSK